MKMSLYYVNYFFNQPDVICCLYNNRNNYELKPFIITVTIAKKVEKKMNLNIL